MNDMLEFARNSHFAKPEWLLFAVLAPVLVKMWRTLQHKVPHSKTTAHQQRSHAWTGLLCSALFVAFWLVAVAAAALPVSAQVEVIETYEAREFVILIDRSGSMFYWDEEAPELAPLVEKFEQEERRALIDARARFPSLYPFKLEALPKRPDGTPPGNIMRFQAARWAAVEFLKSRPDTDRFALGTFDDRVYAISPLGKDRNVTIEEVADLSRKSGGGTNFDGPSKQNKEVGAFQWTINHLRKLGKTKKRGLIFISDGDAGIAPERHEPLVNQMSDGKETTIYALVCGPEKQMTNPETESMRRLIQAVNPKDPLRPELEQTVLWTGNGKAMQKAFALINRLETSTVKSEPITTDRSVRHQFIIAAGILLAIWYALANVCREEI